MPSACVGEPESSASVPTVLSRATRRADSGSSASSSTATRNAPWPARGRLVCARAAPASLLSLLPEVRTCLTVTDKHVMSVRAAARFMRDVRSRPFDALGTHPSRPSWSAPLAPGSSLSLAGHLAAAANRHGAPCLACSPVPSLTLCPSAALQLLLLLGARLPPASLHAILRAAQARLVHRRQQRHVAPPALLDGGAPAPAGVDPTQEERARPHGRRERGELVKGQDWEPCWVQALGAWWG